MDQFIHITRNDALNFDVHFFLGEFFNKSIANLLYAIDDFFIDSVVLVIYALLGGQLLIDQTVLVFFLCFPILFLKFLISAF